MVSRNCLLFSFPPDIDRIWPSEAAAKQAKEEAVVAAAAELRLETPPPTPIDDDKDNIDDDKIIHQKIICNKPQMDEIHLENG